MHTKDIGNYIVYSDGRILKKHSNSFLHTSKNSEGYPLVTIDGVQRKLHRVIAETFIQQSPETPVVNHKDGVKTNNDVSNLEWVSVADNVRHAFRMGLMVRHKGSKNHMSKLNEIDVMTIKKRLRDTTMTQIAKDYKVTIQCISLIKKGKNWGHITVD